MAYRVAVFFLAFNMLTFLSFELLGLSQFKGRFGGTVGFLYSALLYFVAGIITLGVVSRLRRAGRFSLVYWTILGVSFLDILLLCVYLR